MKMEVRIVLSTEGQVAMEADHGFAKNDFLVPLRRTVCVQFDEVPVRSSAYLNASLEPS